MMNDADGPLLDPSLLEKLTPEEREEALAAAAAAKRAEERAEQRALERALAKRQAQRRQQEAAAVSSTKPTAASQSKVVFVKKTERNGSKQPEKKESKQAAAFNKIPQKQHSVPSSWNDAQLAAVKQSYLGKTPEEAEQEQLAQRRKKKSKKKIAFKFEWDNTEDTSADDPLYAGTASVPARPKKKSRLDNLPKSNTPTFESARTKAISEMTQRDWRIFRETYNIVVKGGLAPPPMRQFDESPSPTLPPLHNALLQAIHNVLRYEEPSPIQRQAIPIGLQRRDLIGIAETGSGKTAAFGIPLCHYILNLDGKILNQVANDGPLALVVAPTRELALQINAEFDKLLSCQSTVESCAIVGGQPITQQAQRLRHGVHIVVGTPGRINDCLEMAYLVLNQCCYIVLDEADRMIDMGFAPQMESILQAMGGQLKSSDEKEAHQQELNDLRGGNQLPKHRLTAMFSATMPPEVEGMAKEYLRHPAIISIGDQDSRKNARITQRILFLSSPSQKERALQDLLAKSSRHEKIIVFVNEKKHADGVGRVVERAGKRCVVLHGGKSQDVREENLAMFRKGGVVMVATDVAGRGLDIPDVSHVINYDLPSRSIDNYSHRIGRTGRAGKEGLATSLITDDDEGIMAPLKAYLESTGNAVPERLARHPAANVGAIGKNIT